MRVFTDRISTLSAMTVPVKSEDVTGTYEMKDGGTAGEMFVQQTANGQIKFYINAIYHEHRGTVGRGSADRERR